MKFLDKKFARIGLLVGLVVMATITLAPFRAQAQTFPGTPPIVNAAGGITDWVGEKVGQVAGYVVSATVLAPIGAISALLMGLGGVVIILVTSMIEGLVNANVGISGSIVNSLMVRAGFDVMLSITNLGFVAAMIFIAVATILRLQTYNVKKTLWKLIIAALLVNFSLVFAGGILNLSDQLSGFFLKGISGDGVYGENSISDRLMSVYNAYRLQNPQDNPALATALNNTSFIASMKDGFSEATVEVIALLFTTVGVWIIAAAFAVMGFAIFARYIIISILLILMPIVWLFWIFPGLSQHWSKWWSTFFRWAFFMPVMLFFLWLVLASGTMIQNGGDDPLAKVTASVDPNNPTMGPQAGLASFSPNDGGLFVSIMGTFLQGIIVVGLLVGGLIAANKLSITGAGVALSAVKNIGKGAGKGAWNYTKGKATSTISKPPNEVTKTGFMGALQRLNPVNNIRKAVHGAAEAEQKAGIKGPMTQLAAKGTQRVAEEEERSKLKKEYVNRFGKVRGAVAFAVTPGKPAPTLSGSIIAGIGAKTGLIKPKTKVKPSMALEEFKEVFGIDDDDEAKKMAERLNITIEKKKEGKKEEAPEKEGPKIITEGLEDEFNKTKKT